MLGLLSALVLTQVSPDSVSPDTVYYKGNLVRFYAKTEEVVLLDSAWVRYHDMTVYSDSIHYDTRLHRLSAYGDVLFHSKDQNITGNLLKYDIDTRKGMMRTARTEVENGFFWAEEIWLIKEKVLDARRGCYTTCELEPPHYYFYGPRAKLFIDNVAVIQPVVLVVRGIPVLAAPFWLVPVSSKRKSGLMPFKIGNSKDQGFYAKNLAYYWVINDYADATFYCDIMTRKGIQPRFEAIYIVDPYARGSLQGSYIDEWDTRRRRYSFNASHSSRFFLGTELQAQADFLSDASYAPDYSEEQPDWLKQDIFSYAELSRKVLRVGRFSAQVENKTEFARHRTYTCLPKARISFGTRSLPFNWNASPSLSFEHFFWTYADSTDKDTAHTTDLKARAGLGLASPDYSLGKAGELRISHGLGFSESRSFYNDTLHDQSRTIANNLNLETSQKPLGIFNTYEDLAFAHTDDISDTVLPEPCYTASLTSTFSLFRVFDVRAIGMHGLLHTARPSIALSYKPEVTPAGFFGKPQPFSPKAADLNLGILNGFEAKVGSLGTKRNLGRMNFTSAYDLKEKKLSPLRAAASILPFQSISNLNLQIDARASFIFDSMELGDDYSVTTSLTWNKLFARKTLKREVDTSLHHPHNLIQNDWRIQLRLNHTYARKTDMVTGMFTLYAPGWKFTLNSIGYNFQQKKLTDYSLTIWKDLHCWEALINLNRLGPRWKYDFEVRIKKLPDVKFGKGTFRTFLPD